MDEVKELMKAWQDGGYVNPDGLSAAFNAISILVEKVELQEKQIAELQSLREG